MSHGKSDLGISEAMGRVGNNGPLAGSVAPLAGLFPLTDRVRSTNPALAFASLSTRCYSCSSFHGVVCSLPFYWNLFSTPLFFLRKFHLFYFYRKDMGAPRETVRPSVRSATSNSPVLTTSGVIGSNWNSASPEVSGFSTWSWVGFGHRSFSFHFFGSPSTND